MKSSDLRIVVYPAHVTEKVTPQAAALDSPSRSLKRRLREGLLWNVNTISSSGEYLSVSYLMYMTVDMNTSRVHYTNICYLKLHVLETIIRQNEV